MFKKSTLWEYMGIMRMISFKLTTRSISDILTRIHNHSKVGGYLPGNGALLQAVAVMAAGFDGGEDTPGFPKSWKVRHEGLVRLP